MTDNLHYTDGKKMNPDPINIDMDVLVERLDNGVSTIVQLEPGDATYYSLLIVPVWSSSVAANLGRFGIPLDNSHNYLIVAKLGSCGGTVGFVPLADGKLDTHHFADFIENGWSQVLLAWWFNILKKKLGR